MENTRRYGRGNARPAPMPVDELRRLLAYDRETGILTWRDCPQGGQGSRRMRSGSMAGCKNVWGYVVVRIARVLYPAHRVAWFLETGVWPPDQIDHLNEVKSDNRWINLRLATHAENTMYRHQNRIAREGPKPKQEPSDLSRILKNGRLTSDEVRGLFAYDPDTGLLSWRENRGCNFNRRPAGSTAGTKTSHGYIAVKIGKSLHKAHRLIWVVMTGEWPPRFVDHINGDKSDNRWSNLRLPTPSQNMHARNTRTGASGYRGVSRNGNGFRANIRANGKLLVFPTRATAEEAYADYCAAAVRHHGEFAKLT